MGISRCQILIHPPGLLRRRPLETRPNLRSWDESLARGRQNRSAGGWINQINQYWSRPGRIAVFQDQRTCRCAWSHRKDLSFVWIWPFWPVQFWRGLRWQPLQMVLESHKLSVQTPSSSIRSLCESAFLRLDRVKSQLEEEKRPAITLQKYS